MMLILLSRIGNVRLRSNIDHSEELKESKIQEARAYKDMIEIIRSVQILTIYGLIKLGLCYGVLKLKEL